MSSQCPGCSKSFTASGLSNHLAQTRQAECISARNAAHQSRPIPSHAPPSLPDDFDIDAEPVQFEGDYFGTYTDADFDDPPSDSGSDSEDEELDDEVEIPSWEPVPRSLADAAAQATQAMDDTPDSNPSAPESATNSNPQAANQADRHAAETTFRKTRNTYVIPFPLHTAGARIPPEDCSSEARERVMYEHYQQGLDITSQNPYAPFTCRRDWEVARWAKMRGPGSTAFSDLLAIESVSSCA